MNQLQFKLNRGFSGRAAFYPARSQKIKSRVKRGCHKLVEFMKVKN